MLKYVIWLSALLVAEVLLFCRVKYEVANRSNESVNPEGYRRKNEVEPRSAYKSLRLKRGAVDDDASYPAQEEGKQETNEIVFFHFNVLLSIKTMLSLSCFMQ